MTADVDEVMCSSSCRREGRSLVCVCVCEADGGVGGKRVKDEGQKRLITVLEMCM